MTESSEEREKRLLRELEGKTVAHYSVMLDAWVQTRMARDKTLIALSAGGVGVLVTLLTTKGISQLWEIVLYLFSFLGFLITIGLALKVYQKNSELIENSLREKSSGHLKLEAYDRATIRAFYCGAIFTFAVAVSSAVHQILNQGVQTMPNYEKKSLDGIQNLKPQQPQEQPPAPLPAQQSSTATTPPTSESPKK
ncbi:MAG: hypothetical protein JSR29_05555 [Nitrospira sp.]|nr:hypothetical protein [Nitrospira sp.]